MRSIKSVHSRGGEDKSHICESPELTEQLKYEIMVLK
jgi:hypothetical protein